MRRRLLAAIAVFSLIGAACTTHEPSMPDRASARAVRETGDVSITTSTTHPRLPVVVDVTSAPVAGDASPGFQAARLLGATDVYRARDDIDPARTLRASTILGTPTVVRVLDRWGTRLHVALPGRPNGGTGWISMDDVELFNVSRMVVVDLSERSLVVLEDDQVIYETTIGVGSSASPTPTGSFFVTDAVIVTRPSGPWGPYAFGLSARSDHVTEFNGGDGIIGIHGTNRPGSIGRAESLGCIRLQNDRMAEVFELLSVGTPVEIQS